MVGNSVPPMPARVLAIDGVEVELEYLDLAPKASRVSALGRACSASSQSNVVHSLNVQATS